jgi:hypothetical protein
MLFSLFSRILIKVKLNQKKMIKSKETKKSQSKTVEVIKFL